MIILAVGMPRAGSGWHFNLTHGLVVAGGGSDSREVRTRYRLESILTRVNCNIGVLSLRRLARVVFPAGTRETFTVKLHAGPTRTSRVLIRLGALRPTFIYRDPRDALISAYEYGERARAAGKSNAFSPLTSLDAAIEFIQEYVGYWSDWMAVPGCHTLRYEDLKSDYEAEAARLAVYLGLDPEAAVISAAIETYRPEKASSASRGLHFVHGRSARYLEILSPAQQQRCLDLFGSELEKMGYTTTS
jgi:hypothetical protein